LIANIAQALVVSARRALDIARANAASRHRYLTPYVKPTLLESASYPLRGRMTFPRFLASHAIWIVGLIMLRSLPVHQIQAALQEGEANARSQETRTHLSAWCVATRIQCHRRS
jgi:hypothetical protein